ncbi:GIY-YIG nuclease family protein [Roseibium suaedae]|uniref:hypothetical protein n=1 Tax=Roseibium suaedae TaxID=735517 RepID=UPI00093451D7|nr:hypothetical protein [Roseibium suaedae]
MFEHQSGTGSVFTAKYDIHSLVFFEVHTGPEQAIRREKQIKRWRRAWKVRLIEENNPNWTDLQKHFSKPEKPHHVIPVWRESAKTGIQ